MNILIGLLTVVHVLVAIFVIVLVLMQKSSEQGVGAAFGGGVTETVFGAGTTTALVRMTVYCGCTLLATTLLLAVLHSHRRASQSLMQRSLANMPINTAPAQPASPFSSMPSTPASGTAPAPTAPATTPSSTPAPAATPASTPAQSSPAAAGSPAPAAPADKTP
jgi:preprotein translocase subunit SecG